MLCSLEISVRSVIKDTIHRLIILLLLYLSPIFLFIENLYWYSWQFEPVTHLTFSYKTAQTNSEKKLRFSYNLSVEREISDQWRTQGAMPPLQTKSTSPHSAISRIRQKNLITIICFNLSPPHLNVGCATVSEIRKLRNCN